MIDNFRQRNAMTSKPGTGYKLYDTFMSQVLPGIRSAMRRNRSYNEEGIDDSRRYESFEKDKERNFQLQQSHLANIAEMQKQQNRPMNVVWDRFDEISAKDKKAFELQERGLDIRDENLDQKLELDRLKQAETERKNKAGEGLTEQKIAIQKYKVENPDTTIYEQPGGDAIIIDKQGNIRGRIGPSGILTEAGKIEKKLEADKDLEKDKQTGRETLQNMKGWTISNIPDPNDPTKTIGVRINQDTGETLPITLGDKPVGEITRPGTKSGTSKQPVNLDAIRATTQSTLDLIDNEIFDKEGNLQPDVSRAIGASRAFGGAHIPFQAGVTGEAKLNQLRDKLVIGLIGEMKAQSRTGATGFGAMNLKELEVLMNAASKLNARTMPEEDFINELLSIKSRLEMILKDEAVQDNSGPGGKPPITADMVRQLREKYGRKP